MVQNLSSPKYTLDLFDLGDTKVCWVFSNHEIQFSHLLNCFFLPDPKSPQFSSEDTTPTKFPKKHLNNWSQGKSLLATKSSTPGWKYSSLLLPIADEIRWTGT